MNSDFRDLLAGFTANGVRYLVVGGYAVMEYSEPRYTKDLDIWIAADPANADRVYRALAEFGAPLGMLAPDDFAQEGYFYSIGVPPVRIDILMSLPGMAFEQAWPNRVAAAFDGTTVWFVAPDDLIAIKQASGRRQDIRDAKAIRRARANRPPPR